MKPKLKLSGKFLPRAIAALLFLSSGVGFAAPVTWESPVAIGDGSTAFSIDTGYSLFAAERAGTTDATVGGINFVDETTVSFSGGNGFASETDFYTGSADPGLNTLLDSRYASFSNPGTITVGLSGLQVGKEYTVALYFADRNRTPDRSYTATAGNTSDAFIAEQAVHLDGTFTADSATQNITVSGPFPLVSAVLVTVSNAPPPSTAFNVAGGDMLVSGNWTSGLPVSPTHGTSSLNGVFNDGNAGVANWLLDVVGGTVAAGQDWRFTGSSLISIAGGTLQVAGDILADDASIITFDSGTISWGGVLGTGEFATGSIVINGGAFDGTETGTTTFGNDGGNGTITITGGTVMASLFEFGSLGSNRIGGSAVLSGGSSTFGALDIESGWTGSFTLTSLSGNDWQDQFEFGGITLDGQSIDPALFPLVFTVSNAGQTLSLNSYPAGTYPAVFDGKTFTVVEVDPFKSGEEPGGNTQRADGSGTFWANTEAVNNDGLWRERTTTSFGYDNIPLSSGRIFEASLDDQTNAPALRQTVSGLAPDTYEVVLLFTSRTDGNTVDVGGTQGILNGSIGDPGTKAFTFENADSSPLANGDGGNAIWSTYYGVLGYTDPGATGFTVDIKGLPGTNRTQVMAVAYRAVDLTDFNGGNMFTVGNWTNGLPVDPVIGRSSQSGSFNDGNLGVADWLLTVTGGTITASQDWHFTGASEITFDSGTLNVSGNVLIDGTSEMTFNGGTLDVAGNIGVEDSGRLTFNGGTISWGGGFDTGLGFDSRIVINGGTFIGGAGSSFGNAAGSGIMTINAGSISAVTIDFSSSSGSATLGGDGSISGESAIFGLLDIKAGWSGTLTIDSFSGSNWENVFLSGDITYNGAILDAPGFAATFFVSPDGKSLGTEPFVVAEPKLTVVGFNGSGGFVIDATGLDPGKTYELKRGTDLAGFPDTVGNAVTGVGSTQFIDEEPPGGRAFYVLEEQVGAE